VDKKTSKAFVKIFCPLRDGVKGRNMAMAINDPAPTSGAGSREA
jgi:hypothetical protein